MPAKFYFNSPIGEMEIVIEDEKILSIEFLKEVQTKHPQPPADNKVFKNCSQQLSEYFEGKRSVFSLPVFINGTPFQNEVWRELINIPLGTSISYSELAIRLGRPKAVRAVGAANGQNPFVIVVPCHRVIGKNGKLTGYGGGLWRKKWLLEHEAAMTDIGLFRKR